MYTPYNEYKITVSHQAWKEFQKKYPKSKELGIDYWKFRRILSTLREVVEDEVLGNTDGVQLPMTLGRLRIAGFKVHKPPKHCKLQLARTDHRYYKLEWDIKFQRFKLRALQCYDSITAKLFKVKLIQWIKSDNFFHWTIYADYTDRRKWKNPNTDKLKQTTDLLKNISKGK